MTVDHPVGLEGSGRVVDRFLVAQEREEVVLRGDSVGQERGKNEHVDFVHGSVSKLLFFIERLSKVFTVEKCQGPIPQNRKRPAKNAMAEGKGKGLNFHVF